tara:strand:+ start:546 stop:1202 length:657 start_codon:yes stop_codon:yes gene_type:complete
MRNYIKSNQNSKFFTVSNIDVIIKDDLAFNLDREELGKILDSFPKQYLYNIDYVIFGNFDFMRKKQFNASYHEGAIYVLNTQEDNESVLDDIVHEVGHAVEEQHGSFLYSDGRIEKEFLQKRKLLKIELEKHGYKWTPEAIFKSQYEEALDMFFYDTVGYPIMTVLVQGIYYSPYAATSIHEYFANGFEAFYYHKDPYLKRVSPVLYEKLQTLEEEVI